MLEFSDAGYRFFQARPSPFFIRVGRAINRHFILPGTNHLVKELQIEGETESLREARAHGDRVLFVINHPSHSDPQVTPDRSSASALSFGRRHLSKAPPCRKNVMKNHPQFAGVRVGLVLIALCGLAAPGHAQSKPESKPESKTETTADTEKAAPVIARLEKAIVEKDKFGAEVVLAELETLIPSDGRLSGLRERVTAMPGPKKNLTVDLGGGVTMDFVLIRPGSFTMGSDKVAHKVTLTQPFYLGKYEVTQEQWEKVMGRNPSNFKGAKNPVENVIWTDCQSFVAKLQEKLPGQPFRLPTEAEWEFACRAGTTGDFCYGDGEGSLAEYAWYDSNANRTTHPVGERKPNAWGLYDMHGNVWEWCADWYGNYPATAVVDPQGASSGSDRVVRGGSWSMLAGYCRVAYRSNFVPGDSGSSMGFRVARSSVP
jgi:formylglycine-generating enzyme required for sulfatase activity